MGWPQGRCCEIEIIIDNVEPSNPGLGVMMCCCMLLTSALQLDSILESHLISFGKSLN